MSRVGDCWDNAVVARCFATVTKELRVDGLFATRAVASRALFAVIESWYNWYNRQRRHSTRGDQTPAAFEAQLQKIR